MATTTTTNLNQTPKLRKVYIVNHDEQAAPISIIENEAKSKETTYTITRTYVAPNGTTKTKTIEYHGDEAKKVGKIIAGFFLSFFLFLIVGLIVFLKHKERILKYLPYK